MRRLTRRPLLALPLLLAGPPAVAETLRLATLDWPPYTGEALALQGASTAVLRAALRSQGHALELGFMPWARAVLEGSQGRQHLGYFPAYQSEERDRQSLRSERIGASRVGFAYHRGQSFSWRSLDELAQQRIGVVRGFVNTVDFDQRMRDGRLRTEPAVSDLVNLRKLGLGRVDMVVIDQAVFHALTGPRGELAAYREQLVFDSAQLLEEKPLHVYFQRHAEGERWRSRLDRGLAQIDVAAVFRRALEGLDEASAPPLPSAPQTRK